MSKNVSVGLAGSGLSTAGLLGVVFVTLKLCGVITWSWWWVTAPFWGGVAIALALVLSVIAVYLVVAGVVFSCRWVYHLIKERKK